MTTDPRERNEYRTVSLTPFETDIAAQPDALRAFAQSPISTELASLLTRDYDRIVLSGMGSSHHAALPTWRALVAAGLPAWWVDTGQLLDSPALITPGTLVMITSQSGASGEVAALIERDRRTQATTLISITNDPTSPLGRAGDALLPLHSGDEATVSTKSYLNSLAAHQRILRVLTGSPGQDPEHTSKVLEALRPPTVLAELAAAFAVNPDARIVFVGFGDHAATALYAGLITKEAAKIPAEGYIGGQFRHGPLELAGPGLTAVLFSGGHTDPARPSLQQLGTDLLRSGSTVLAVGDIGLSGTLEVPTPSADLLDQLAHGAVVAQHLTVELATAKNITPGSFLFGSKITSAL
jgi:glucosamine--fructose-6-phosphate aminotransferase (isomerizing)